MELSAIRKELTQADVSFTVLGEEVNVKVNLGGLSPSSQTLLLGFEQGDNQDLGALVKIMTEIIFDWDIENNGEPFPPTYENISSIPVEVLGILLSGIIDGVNGLGKDGQEPSSASTKPKAKPRQSSKPKSRSGSPS